MGVTAAVTAAIGTGYQIYSGEKAASEAQDDRDRIEQQAREKQDKIEADEKSKALGAQAKAQRSAQRVQSGYGRGSTILTGPLGLGSDSASPAKSTLLGG
jgi:negative regulator of sigma E activity